MRSAANFGNFFSESQNANSLDAELEPDLTQNDHSWSFKVIGFSVNEEPLKGYVVQYNNCDLECEGSEDISERKKRKSPFTTTPLSFDAPYLANPRKY